MANPKKAPTGQVNTWQARLAEDAAIAAKAEAKATTSRPSVSLSGGQVSVGGNALGNDIPVVLLDQIHANLYYPDAYDPKNTVPPLCFALGTINKDGDIIGVDTFDGRTELAPHKDCTERQHTDCATCPMNKYGSARMGDGKACQNTRRVAVIPVGPEDSVEDIQEATIAYLKIPATGLKNFSGFVSRLAKVVKRPMWSMFSALSSEQASGKSYFLPSLTTISPIPDKLMDAVFTRQQQAAEEITFGFAPLSEEDKAKAKAPVKKRKYS